MFVLSLFLQLAIASGQNDDDGELQDHSLNCGQSLLMLQNSLRHGTVVSPDEVDRWRLAVLENPPTAEWCNTATDLLERDAYKKRIYEHREPIEVDAEYLKEEHCYWKWLDENCLSLKDCPRPPFGGHEKIWNRLRIINQKNLILARMMYLLHFFAQKRQVKWAITYGNLLGGVRDQALIPHDNDVDVWLEDTGYPTLHKYFHEDFPPDVHLHKNTGRFLHMRDLNSCSNANWLTGKFAAGTAIGGFAIDFYASNPEQDIEVANYTLSRSDKVGMKFPGFATYDEFFKRKYGDDYMIAQAGTLKRAQGNWTTDIGCVYLYGSSCGIQLNKATGQHLRTTDWERQQRDCEKTHKSEKEWDGRGAGSIPWLGEPFS